MANGNPGAVVAKVAGGSYATRFRDTFGADVFDDHTRAFKAVLLSLEVSVLVLVSLLVLVVQLTSDSV